MGISVKDMHSILQRQLNGFWDVDLSVYPEIDEKIKIALRKTDIGWECQVPSIMKKKDYPHKSISEIQEKVESERLRVPSK